MIVGHQAPIKIESNEDSDVIPIACAMASAFADVVADYEKNWGLSREEAIANVYAGDANAIERIRAAPPDQVSWLDLQILAKHSPELAVQRWQEVKQAARNELKSGHRAASVVASPAGTLCWGKARYLALRAELLEGWQPRNSVERLLLDTLMQLQGQYENWFQVLTSRTTLQAVYEGKDEGRWSPALSTLITFTYHIGV